MEVSDDSDSDDSMELHNLNKYPPPEDTLGDDSDTMPTPSKRSSGDNSSSSKNTRSVKRARGSSNTTLPTKKPSKSKNRVAESNDEISATMKSLRETLVATAPPQMPQLVDPHARLWQKLEIIPLTSDQRILVGEHLSSKENEGLVQGVRKIRQHCFCMFTGRMFLLLLLDADADGAAEGLGWRLSLGSVEGGKLRDCRERAV